jgi:hypothetical protein
VCKYFIGFLPWRAIQARIIVLSIVEFACSASDAITSLRRYFEAMCVAQTAPRKLERVTQLADSSTDFEIDAVFAKCETTLLTKIV